MALKARSALYKRALELIPGGVNSPVRAMKAVGLDEPFFVSHAEGAYLFDVEGNRYLDWVLSSSPLRGTWASYRLRPGSSTCCGSSATRPARCSSSTR